MKVGFALHEENPNERTREGNIARPLQSMIPYLPIWQCVGNLIGGCSQHSYQRSAPLILERVRGQLEKLSHVRILRGGPMPNINSRWLMCPWPTLPPVHRLWRMQRGVAGWERPHLEVCHCRVAVYHPLQDAKVWTGHRIQTATGSHPSRTQGAPQTLGLAWNTFCGKQADHWRAPHLVQDPEQRVAQRGSKHVGSTQPRLLGPLGAHPGTCGQRRIKSVRQREPRWPSGDGREMGVLQVCHAFLRTSPTVQGPQAHAKGDDCQSYLASKRQPPVHHERGHHSVADVRGSRTDRSACHRDHKALALHPIPVPPPFQAGYGVFFPY